MARSVGEQFLHVAMSPLAMAGGSFRRGDVAQGLAELTAESLVGSVDRAIEAVAGAVGLPRGEVERVVPMAELRKKAARMAPIQAASVAQWERHMAHASSLLEAIAKLTADGRPPEAGLCLMRIATKMRLERDLAAPLRELAGLVDAWQETLIDLRTRLDAGKELERARLRRERTRLALIGAAIVGFLGIAAAGGWVARTREQLEDVLTRPNPCEVELLTEDQLRFANDLQREMARSRKSACAAMRESVRQREERERVERERREQEEATKRAKASACDELTKRLDGTGDRTLAAQTLALFDRDASLHERLLRGTLEAEDVTRDLSKLTCVGGKGDAAIASAYAKALAASVETWGPRALPSRSARDLAIRGKSALTHNAREELTRVIDKRALDAIMSGRLGVIEDAVQACEVVQALEAQPRVYCRAILKRYRP
ncbi:MAG: hypothetical protein FJ095_13920 [Deltaproteobacteria bacterium]|nr:hypothetical protein [Deltaproteobacteria bacterium]